ncbi:MAG: 4-hydroxy-3-methylbut-2-enyl diphosphate reductase, partial [Actinomycetota bacterium]
GVVSELAEEGIEAAKDLSEVEDGTIIFRTHGVSPSVATAAGSRGLNIVDATCPYVKVAQEKAQALKEDGYLPVILGEQDHPEVVALLAYAGEKAVTVEDPADYDFSSIHGRVGVVVQTTQSEVNLASLASCLAPLASELLIHNTICNATRMCQEEALQLAAVADAVIVIGGKNSANTNRLANLCRDRQPRTYHIEDISELEKEWFEGAETVAITAGASTPIEQMQDAAEWLKENLH